MPDPEQTPEPAPGGRRTAPKSNLAIFGPWIASALACILFILIIGSIFVGWPVDWDKALLHQLSDTATARGLITFLIAVSTVGIALTLTIFIVATDEPDPKNKFALGKEVLTSLIGVLGTIVGFYFGASTDSTHHAAQLSISKLLADPTTVKKGAVTTVNASLAGGEPPYQYTIVLHQPDTSVQYLGAQGKLEDGTLQSKVTLPDALDAQKTVELDLEVSDKANSISRSILKLTLAP